ncbi:hypothetical protein C8R44DRAFT_874494 [Mycena epipterygia]|nr:hypothetical protein C8R44DRAFT_874494 [Mycena epipterygia]
MTSVIQFPPEVLEAILFDAFKTFITDWAAIQPERFLLCTVCTRFWHIIRNSARFWTTIHLTVATHPNFLRITLARTAQMPLILYTYFSETSHITSRNLEYYDITRTRRTPHEFAEDVFPIIVPYSPRLSGITFFSDFASSWHPLVAEVVRLADAQCTAITTIEIPSLNPVHTRPPSAIEIPGATQIARCFANLPLACPNVTELCLAGIIDLPWRTLSASLQGMRALRTLQLARVSCVIPSDAVAVVLPFVEELMFGYTATSMDDLLALIQMPRISSMHFDACPWQPLLSLIDKCAPLFGSLESMDANLCWMPVQSMRYFMGSLTGVAHLNFHRSDVSIADAVIQALTSLPTHIPTLELLCLPGAVSAAAASSIVIPTSAVHFHNRFTLWTQSRLHSTRYIQWFMDDMGSIDWRTIVHDFTGRWDEKWYNEFRVIQN